MDKRRAVILSFICFAVSIALISGYLELSRYSLTSEFGPEQSVVVAVEAIPEYGVIREEMLEVRKVFKNYVQPQSVSDTSEIVGKSAYVSIYPGEQITISKLINQEGKPVLDRQVEKNMRAITLPIQPYSGVGRLIRPGNHIDLLAAVNYERDGVNLFEIKTVVQNALVLATGKNIQNDVPTRVDREVLSYIGEQFESRRRKDWGGGSMDSLATNRADDNYSNITLQVNMPDAEKIAFLSNKFGDNRLYFTLRNGADTAIEEFDTALLDDVLGPNSDYGESKKKPPAPPPSRGPRFYDNLGSDVIGVE